MRRALAHVWIVTLAWVTSCCFRRNGQCAATLQCPALRCPTLRCPARCVLGWPANPPSCCSAAAENFFKMLGNAIPASSNFFINYVSFRALAMVPFQLFFPNMTVLAFILKWLHILPCESALFVPPGLLQRGYVGSGPWLLKLAAAALCAIVLSTSAALLVGGAAHTVPAAAGCRAGQP